MRFYTSEKCERWLADRGRSKPDQIAQRTAERFAYPKEPHAVFAMANWMAKSVTYRQPALLWITEWGIWPSSENWHLYYKLRQTYGDFELLHESPGHLFLEHESEDLVSFTQLAMLNGWGGYVLTHADYVNAFFSHDEFIDFYAAQPENLDDVRQYFGQANDSDRVRMPPM